MRDKDKESQHEIAKRREKTRIANIFEEREGNSEREREIINARNDANVGRRANLTCSWLAKRTQHSSLFSTLGPGQSSRMVSTAGGASVVHSCGA